MLKARTLVVRSIAAFAMSVALIGADAVKPNKTAAKPAACSSTAPRTGAQVADIDSYGRCVFRCLQRRGTPDYCAQSCAVLLQPRSTPTNEQQEKQQPPAEELAEPVPAE